MLSKKTITNGVLASIAAVVGVGMFAPVVTSAFSRQGRLFDNFLYEEFIILRDQEISNNPKWYTLAFGIDPTDGDGLEENGTPYKEEARSSFNDYAKVEIKRERDGRKIDSFARITIDEDAPEGIYSNVDITDVRLWTDTSLESGRFNVSDGESLTFKFKARYSDLYTENGVGDAVGTSGFYIWNAGYNELGLQFEELDAFGFQWLSDESLLGQLAGLRTGYWPSSTPAYSEPIPFEFDINDWFEMKVVWSQEAGQQSAEYYLNDQLVGSTQFVRPIINASIEIWADNQTYNVNPDFTPGPITYESPIEDQYVDIDRIVVFKTRN